MSSISQRIGTRYDQIVELFRQRPFGEEAYLEDLSTLSILPPVDRCIIIEKVIQCRYGNPIAWADKLSMAYVKAGWENLAQELVLKFYQKGWLPQQWATFLMEKLQSLSPTNVTTDYKEALEKLHRYGYEATLLGQCIKDLCTRYEGDELDGNINLRNPLQMANWMDFIQERRMFIKSL